MADLSIRGKGYNATYELLVSIYNPNRVGVHVSAAAGHLTYGSARVAEVIYVAPMIIPAGSVADTMVTMALSTDMWDTMGIIYDYEYKKDLVLNFFTTMDFRVLFGPIGIPMSYSVNNMSENLNVPTAARPHCKCPAF